MSTGVESIPGRPARRWAASLRQRQELVLHLAGRELKSSHRRTALGWSWPLLLQITQLAALVFLFTKVLKLNVPDYPTFVFSGLIFWSFFVSGVTSAASAVTDHPALVLEPRMPSIVLPFISLAVAGFDLLVASAVLVPLVAFTIGWSSAALWVLALCAIQVVMMAGVALLAASLHVYVRDVQPLVGVITLIGFYVTPVFYSLTSIPGRYQHLIKLNPMAVLVDGYHRTVIDGTSPHLVATGLVALFAVAILIVGFLVFRRLSPGFADEL